MSTSGRIPCRVSAAGGSRVSAGRAEREDFGDGLWQVERRLPGAGRAEVMAENSLEREIGSLITQIEVLNREMKEIKTDVRELRDEFSSIKGGGRVMMGIAAFLGSGLTWGLTQLFGKH